MENLSKLLGRFSKILNRDASTKDAIIRVILEKAKVSLNPENIFLKDGILQIDSSPAAKNEISFKEQVIRDELKERHYIFVSRILYK